MCALVRKRVTKPRPLTEVVMTGEPCRWCRRPIWSALMKGTSYCSHVCQQRERTYAFTEQRDAERSAARATAAFLRAARESHFSASR